MTAGARSREAILGATLDLLAEHGFTGLAVDAVAARAGVGKATIYRHWGSRASLVVDAARSLHEDRPDVDTGSVRNDVVELLSGLSRHLLSRKMGPVHASLVDAAERDDELAELLQQLAKERRQPLLQALGRGVERGELPKGTDIELAADLLCGPLIYRRLVRRTRTTTADIERSVDVVLRGVGT